jgi:hypothetical protein
MEFHYPPLCGIVQLANSDALSFRNWSFTNKGLRAKNCSNLSPSNKIYLCSEYKYPLTYRRPVYYSMRRVKSKGENLWIFMND